MKWMKYKIESIARSNSKYCFVKLLFHLCCAHVLSHAVKCVFYCSHSQWLLYLTGEATAEGKCVSPLRMFQGEGQLLGELSHPECCWKSTAAIILGHHTELRAHWQGVERSEKCLWPPRRVCKMCWTSQTELTELESGPWGCRQEKVMVKTWTSGIDAGSGQWDLMGRVAH